MAFVEFLIKKGNSNPLPKGQCGLNVAKDGIKVTISAPDAQNGLKAHNYVKFLYDAATHTLGVKKSENASGASRITRFSKTGIVRVIVPAQLRGLLAGLEVKSGRYYFVDNPEVGFYTINLSRAVPE
jgi:hypothetical protein